jgi:hypothetical protein
MVTDGVDDDGFAGVVYDEKYQVIPDAKEVVVLVEVVFW